MADATRFPRLAPPFAIVGAAAGWLSAGLLSNPLVMQIHRTTQPWVALVAGICAAIAGALSRHRCAGRRYGYELVAPDPSTRLATDRTWRHVLVMLATGVVTGGIIGTQYRTEEIIIGAGAGATCAIVFVPVGLAVIDAARRAQRARLGSIVAAADRRAVWSILATTLGVTTFEALPDWPGTTAPVLAVAILACAIAIVVIETALDVRAHHSLRSATRCLEERAGEIDMVPLDLGLGDDLGARVERIGAAYRSTERTLALVHGSPTLARKAMSRAVIRGWASIGVLAVTACLHVAATSGWVRDEYVRIHGHPKGECATNTCGSTAIRKGSARSCAGRKLWTEVDVG